MALLFPIFVACNDFQQMNFFPVFLTWFQSLCSLLDALDCRGIREALLVASLEKREIFLCQAMSNILNDSGDSVSPRCGRNFSREDSSSSAISDVDNLSLVEVHNGSTGSKVPVGRKGEHQQDKWNSAQAFDTWMWKSFYCSLAAVKRGKRSYLDSLARCEQCHDLYWRDEKHCRICHTTFELDFDLEEKYAIHTATCRQNLHPDKLSKYKILASELQSLKAAIHAIEVGCHSNVFAASIMRPNFGVHLEFFYEVLYINKNLITSIILSGVHVFFYVKRNP